ncbi:uncharacterized protein LOC134701602 [Mytilus trossulus]|uniref:uncharacterized protein LOC134701602 n=1 Tax=Mytilus trossulus TaxID=6551 RepID=UPI003003D4AA
MATSSQSCGVCDQRHINKPSTIWCTECDEGLCTECQEHHSLSKGTRNHKVTPIIEYTQLPADVLKISQSCSKHNQKFQIYCQRHECPCCSKCIVESHKECHDIVNLDDVILNSKTSNALFEIEETLVEVVENIKQIREHQQDNLSTLKERRKEIEEEIEKTRIKINNRLDKLQKDLIKQLNAYKDKENSKIRQLISSLEQKEKEVADCQRNIRNIKQHGTHLQMFLSMKPIQEDISSKEKFLHSLFQGEDLNQNSLEYKINGAIQNIMSNVTSFGEVYIEAKPCDLVLSRKNAKQAQIMVPTVQARSIEDIQLRINKTINIQGQRVYGCCMLLDGRLVFTFRDESTVKVFNMEGSKDFEMEIPCGVFHIVNIGDTNTLVVTSGESEKQCLTIIDLERKLIKKTISLASQNYGLVLRDNQLIYSAYNKGIRMINLYDESSSNIVQEEMATEGYLATFKDNIYHTNRLAHTVTCYNLQGGIQWTFQNESVLDNPLGVAVDNDGYVYVVGFWKNNLVVISPDGQQHREVLTERDGLYNPVSIHYCGLKKQLLVANWNDQVHLFDFI